MHVEGLTSVEPRGRYGVLEAHCMAPRAPAADGPRAVLPRADFGAAESEPAGLGRDAEPAQLAQLVGELDAACARAPQLEAALVLQLLEAIEAPVFVLHASGRLAQANALGRSWLHTQAGCDALLALRAALLAGTQADGFLLTKIQVDPAADSCWLARGGLGTRVMIDVVVQRARHAWELRERSVRVLEQVACGRSNKEIAAVLGRSEVTVERHLTQLFRRAGCQSRAELIAKLYAL